MLTTVDDLQIETNSAKKVQVEIPRASDVVYVCVLFRYQITQKTKIIKAPKFDVNGQVLQ